MSDPAGSPIVKLLPHPKNAWYVLAWGHEVTSESILARTVADRPLAVYRTDDGRPVALADACWHRLAPLSRGKRVGADEVQCPYHGLQYNSAGRCTYMPAQDTINPSALVPSYPVVERHGFVWVWVGDPIYADHDLIPDMWQMTAPQYAGDGLLTHVKANYQLMLDNLMDLTHEEFVHSDSIGHAGMSKFDFTVTHLDRTVVLTRWMMDIEPPPFVLQALQQKVPGYNGRIDRCQIIHFLAPSTICINGGAAVAGSGAPEGNWDQGLSSWTMNTVTPETDTSSHYFWAFRRDFGIDDEALTASMTASIDKVFQQDKEILAAQQEAIEKNPDFAFYGLNIDAGGMWTRRVLQQMLDDEGALGADSQSEFSDEVSPKRG